MKLCSLLSVFHNVQHFLTDAGLWYNLVYEYSYTFNEACAGARVCVCASALITSATTDFHENDNQYSL
jgi:hypothetical protein